MTLHRKFAELADDFQTRYAERATEIDLGIKALLTSQHYLTVGAPGTAKSMLAHDLALAFEVPYMRKLLGKDTPPEEMFGPYDLKQMKTDGRLVRITSERTAQKAVIQFWDEIFKSSSAIRNKQLTILNERYYDHGEEFYKVPLISVFAASNELPDDSEESGAFFDRFLIRRFVSYIKDPNEFIKMMRTTAHEQQKVMTEDDLRSAIGEVQEVRIPQSVEEAYLDLRAALDLEGVIVSDRRWKQTLDLLRANAWQEGRDTADTEDMVILQHALWEDPSHVKPVLRAVLALASPVSHAVVDIMDQLDEIEGQLREEVKLASVDGTESARNQLREQGIEWFTKVEGLVRSLADLEEKVKHSDGRSTTVVDEAMQRAEALTVLIGADAMKLTGFNRAKDKMKERVFGTT
jgi:MoxR-like ATPase